LGEFDKVLGGGHLFLVLGWWSGGCFVGTRPVIVGICAGICWELGCGKIYRKIPIYLNTKSQ
jgi:hypothetical protein